MAVVGWRMWGLLLLAWIEGAAVLFSPGPSFGRHQLPSQSAHVPRSVLSDLTCLRNRRKNSAVPSPEVAQTGFTARSRLKFSEDYGDDDDDEDDAVDYDEGDRAPRRSRARSPTSAGVWSNRSQAAKRRWADPEYRAKVVKKRRENAAPKRAPNSGLAIGPLDSVVFSPSPAQTEIWRSKADEINRWARANQLRREGTLRWKRDPMGWTLDNLASGDAMRSRLNNDTYKSERQQQRKLEAMARWETRRRNTAAAEDAATAALAAEVAKALGNDAGGKASQAGKVAEGG